MKYGFASGAVVQVLFSLADSVEEKERKHKQLVQPEIAV